MGNFLIALDEKATPSAHLFRLGNSALLPFNAFHFWQLCYFWRMWIFKVSLQLKFESLFWSSGFSLFFRKWETNLSGIILVTIKISTWDRVAVSLAELMLLDIENEKITLIVTKKYERYAWTAPNIDLHQEYKTGIKNN